MGSQEDQVAAFRQDVRRGLGWSNAKLARRVDVHPNTVAKWMTGKAPIPKVVGDYVTVLLALKSILEDE